MDLWTLGPDLTVWSPSPAGSQVWIWIGSFYGQCDLQLLSSMPELIPVLMPVLIAAVLFSPSLNGSDRVVFE
jgi:hypothetical protein